nr:transposase [Candidatus Omnitrophota bacterium]
MADIIELIERGEVKRYFRARNKYCFEGAISHITQHASGTEPLFLEDADYLYMLHLIKEVLCKFKCNVLSFVLMSNHLHLLLKFLGSNMSDIMKKLLQRYAVYFNKKYQRKGHVFCGAYRSALCFDDSYLLASSLYIHVNPAKAELANNPVDYRWSSCALFLDDAEKETFVDYKFILEILDNDICRAKMKYRNLLKGFNVGRISNVFEKPDALDAMARMLREKNKEWRIERNLPDDYDIEKRIEQLRKKGRLTNPQEIKARMFLIEQLKSRGFHVSEIAEKLNLTRQAIYKLQSSYTPS